MEGKGWILSGKSRRPATPAGKSRSSSTSPMKIVMAFVNIQKAARHYGVNLSEGSWHDLDIRRKRRKAPPDGYDVNRGGMK